MRSFVMFSFFVCVVVFAEPANCPCPPKTKPKPRPAVRYLTPKTITPQQKQDQDQDNEQEQDQKQRQTVNVHVHNEERHSTSVYRSNFKVGLHVGCGPTSVKKAILAPGINNYLLKNDLVVGGSVSVRVLGPVWITGQAFSNNLLTGGIEIEF